MHNGFNVDLLWSRVHAGNLSIKNAPDEIVRRLREREPPSPANKRLPWLPSLKPMTSVKSSLKIACRSLVISESM